MRAGAHVVDGAPAAPPPEASGLSTAEARRRLAQDGPNRLVPRSRRRRWRRLVGPLADPMVALLLVAAPTYLVIGETTDAVVALAAVVPIAAVGWFLEARAERTLDKLRSLTAPTAVVWRDGTHRRVPVEELVVGDVVSIREGDIVPADVSIADLSQLQIDESALTGESLPVDKDVGDGAWAGTTVLAGRAVARVTATGPRTRYGRIGQLLASTQAPATPLQRALSRLVGGLAVVAAVFCTAVMAAELWRGEGWGNAVIAGVSLAIAAIPEEFAMVYGLYLALGAWELARGRALVRRLPGVETLGSTTVICTDKTGTLTEGRLSVGAVESVGADDLELLEAAVLASEPEPYDPLDVAIVEEARRRGIDVDALHTGHLVADWPFDPTDKYLTHVWRLAGGQVRVAAKGAYEGLVAHAHADEEVLGEVHDRLAAAGMRVVAVAGGQVPAPSGDRATDERTLRVLGLVAFRDPVRPGVAEALEQCRTAGIRVVLVTGDHPATAHAVAEGLDLPHEIWGQDLIATGDDLDHADPDRLERLVIGANVFARTRPEHKHLLVEALRRRGEVVAMTGDGINDAPALQAAHIGIAMGQRGTEVARDAATIVLLDDNFATIVAAARNGRRIYDNLAHAFAYLVAFHPPLLVAALVVPLLGRPLLLLPVHLVTLELLLHPVVSLVFQADPAEPDVMQRPPRRAGSALGLRALWRPYAIGFALAAGVLGAYLAALDAGWPTEEARGLGFAILLLAQPLLVLVSRSPDRPFWRQPLRATPQLVAAVAAMAAVTAGVLYVPAVAALLQVEPFPAWAWWPAATIAAVATLWLEPGKRRGRRRSSPGEAVAPPR